MIFVTVGTHEQQFNRLIRHIDNLVHENKIKDQVFMQIGYSDYVPKYCEWKKFLTFQEMKSKIINANIVITHGGPASFLSVLEEKKTPIVVPRYVEFNEHVNNHQSEFAKKIIEKGYNIILIEDINDLEKSVNLYSNDGKSFFSNNKIFNEKLEIIINDL